MCFFLLFSPCTNQYRAQLQTWPRLALYWSIDRGGTGATGRKASAPERERRIVLPTLKLSNPRNTIAAVGVLIAGRTAYSRRGDRKKIRVNLARARVKFQRSLVICRHDTCRITRALWVHSRAMTRRSRQRLCGSWHSGRTTPRDKIIHAIRAKLTLSVFFIILADRIHCLAGDGLWVMGLLLALLVSLDQSLFGAQEPKATKQDR